MSNPFHRKNLVIPHNSSVEDSHSQYSYNKYLVNEFTPAPENYPYFSSPKSHYDSSRPSETRLPRESETRNADSINYSQILNLFEKKSSYVSYN